LYCRFSYVAVTNIRNKCFPLRKQQFFLFNNLCELPMFPNDNTVSYPKRLTQIYKNKGILRQIYVARNNKTHYDLYVTCLKHLCEFKEFLTFRQNFVDIPNTKFHGNTSSGKSADTCRQTDGKTYRHDEVNWRFSPLMKTGLKIDSIFFVYL
jgi:hypothetical protein